MFTYLILQIWLKIAIPIANNKNTERIIELIRSWFYVKRENQIKKVNKKFNTNNKYLKFFKIKFQLKIEIKLTKIDFQIKIPVYGFEKF